MVYALGKAGAYCVFAVEHLGYDLVVPGFQLPLLMGEAHGLAGARGPVRTSLGSMARRHFAGGLSIFTIRDMVKLGEDHFADPSPRPDEKRSRADRPKSSHPRNPLSQAVARPFCAKIVS